MKKIGIIGGLGPEPTIEYYKIITSYFQEQDEGCPRIIIYSMDVDELADLFEEDKHREIVAVLEEGLLALNGAGADFGLIAANTPHIVFDDLKRISPLPLLSIVDETASAVRSRGLEKVGLLGTKFTMQSDLYQRPLEPHGIEVFVPEKNEQEYVQDKIYNELARGVFDQETREGLLGVVEGLIERNGIEGLILGCTELPLILEKDEFGIPFLNTTRIHAEAAVAFCLSD